MKLMTVALLGLCLSSFAVERKIAKDSKVGFEIVKYKIAKVVEGKFNEFSGTVNTAEGKINGVNVEIKATSIDTASEKRDKHLRSSDFFDVEKEGNDVITFKSDKSVVIKDSFKLPGILTIKGNSRPVTLDVTRKDVGVYEAETTIDKRKFGLSWNKPLPKSDWAALQSSLQGFAGSIIGDKVKVKLMVKLD